METSLLFEAFKDSVARRLKVPRENLFGRGLKLSEIIVRSPTAINSIDLMEAIAGAIAEHQLDDRLKIPVFTLEDSVDALLSEIGAQLIVPQDIAK